MNELERKAGSGVEGLDDILSEGFNRNRLYLVEGSPATGKTTIATQSLLEGARRGERGAAGRVRRAISVVKKRTSAHEDTIREYRIHSGGITMGEPLTGFQGVLRGVPELLETPAMALRAGTGV